MILEQTKILTNRYPPEYFSMDLDNRGYPHLVWVEQKNGHFDLIYKFWNGLDWESLETEVIYRSDEDISYVNLVIASGKVLIIFLKKSDENSVIGFVKIDQVVEEIIEYETGGFVNWVSLITDTTEKKRPYVITHEVYEFKVYQLTDENLILKSLQSKVLDDFDNIKVSNTVDNFIIAINGEESIEFNFYDYTSNTWANSSFIELSSSAVGNVVDFDVKGLASSSKAGFTFLRNDTADQIYYVVSDSSGTETTLGTNPIHQVSTSLTAPNGFSIGGFVNVSLSYESDFKPNIFVLGTQNIKLSYNGEWNSDIIGVPTKSESTVFIFNSFNIVTVSSGQIYFFNLVDDAIVGEEVLISLLNAKEFIVSDWKKGALVPQELSFVDNYDNEVGDILRDALSPILVTASNEHPGYASSSSTSSESSPSSSSTSSTSDSSPSSTSYSSISSLSISSQSVSDSSSSQSLSSSSSSSSSGGYSESSSSSVGYSESSSSSIGFSESSSSISESSSEGFSESSPSSQGNSESSSSYSESSSGGYSESSSTGNVRFEYLLCDLFTESISSESSSSDPMSSSSQSMSSKSESSSSQSESSQSESSQSESSSSEAILDSSSSSSSSSDGGVPAAIECTFNHGWPGCTLTDPKVNITLTGINSGNSDGGSGTPLDPYYKTFFGCNFTNGQPQEICGTFGSNASLEYWSVTGSQERLRLEAWAVSSRHRVNVYTTSIWNPNGIFEKFINGGNTFTINNWNGDTTPPNDAYVTPTNWSIGGVKILDEQFGYVVNTDGITIRWDRGANGSGQSW